MRLIDADKLSPNGVFYVCEENPMKSLNELINRIEDAPTAYDVRAVEKQIHEYFKGEVDSLNGEEPWDILKHNRAVCEIVEKGGVADE